jgi:hypothetical protein
VARAAPSEDWPRTVAEFEAWHARQPERWEFVDGQPRLMAPGSLNYWQSKTSTRRPTSPRSFSYGNQSPVI